jgi:hypothetical protein
MSIKKRNFQSGIRLKPDDVALEGNEGEIKVGDTSKKIEAHLDGQDRAVVTEDQTQTLTNKDIDADNNTISNIETDNLKAGVLNTDLSGAATDTEIPSALAVKTALEGQNEASEVEYDPALNPETSATNVQDALDDTGIASQAAQDAADAAQTSIDNHIADATDAHDATAISYDNATSGLTATEVQAAIDEVEGRLDTAETNISTNATGLSDHLADPTDAHDASAISYDNATSGLTATDAQAAIDEVDGDLDAHVAATSAHGVSGDIVGTTDAQTLSNKSIQDPTRLDVKKDTLANLETYALTATNGQFVFATDTKQMLQIVDNALVPVGSGSGGGIDVFFTERFEQTVAADLSSGNNATFLGGGSLAGSLADDESTPIAGDRSITYTQASGSANDYVALPNIELALKEQDNVCGLKVYTIYDGNDSEIDFVVWDVTNSVELARVPIKASTKALEHQAIFETADDTTNITCGFQVVLENDGAVLEFDEIEAKVNPFETTDIFASSEWESFTPTVSSSFNGISSSSGKWRRVGDSMEIEASFVVTGSPSGSVAYIDLPNGHEIDSAKISSSSQNTLGTLYRVNNTDAWGSNNGMRVLWTDASNVDRLFIAANPASDGVMSKGNANQFAANDGIIFSARIPIAGWSNVRQGVTVKNTTSTDITSENVFSARISGGDGSVKTQNIDFIQSSVRDSLGQYTITFKSGLFNGATPSAVVTNDGTDRAVASIDSLSDSSVQVDVFTHDGSSTRVDEDFSIMLQRQDTDFVKERDRVYTVPVGDLITPLEEKVLSTNLTSLQDVSDLTFTGLEVGKVYELTGNVSFGGSQIEIQYWSGAGGTGELYGQNGYVSSGNSYPSVSIKFKASSDTLYTRITNASGTLFGTGTKAFTFLQLQKQKPESIYIGKFGYETAYIKDVKVANTTGGTFTSGAWQTRDLNTIEGDTSFLSLSSNQFSLEPGVYDIEVTAPAFRVDNHKAKIYNISDSSDVMFGSSEYSLNSSEDCSSSLIFGRIVINSTKTFEIQHRCLTTRASNGFGVAANFGEEVYTQVKIVKKR